MAAQTDAELEALEKELELFKSDAARQLDELAALTQAADQCIADSKRETHEARPAQPRGSAARSVGRHARQRPLLVARHAWRCRCRAPRRDAAGRVNAA